MSERDKLKAALHKVLDEHTAYPWIVPHDIIAEHLVRCLEILDEVADSMRRNND